MVSSSSWASIQSIRYSTYLGAETSMGFFTFTPSAHLYSYLHVWRFHSNLISSFSQSLQLATNPSWTKKKEITVCCMYFGPAAMTGQVAGVQNSIRVPYSMFTLLKKSTAAITTRGGTVKS